MEGRISRLEFLAERTQANIADIRQELRALRTEQTGLRTDLHNGLTAMDAELASTFRWIVGLVFTILPAMMGGFAALYTQNATMLARLLIV